MATIKTLDPLQSKIRDLASAALGKHAGMVVGILHAGEEWAAKYGSLGVDEVTPAEDVVFEIGSVTKVFTTLLLAEMVGRGEAALDDAAQKHLPDSVRLPMWRGHEITLLHLATHTSSLPRLPANMWKTVKDVANPYANYQVSELYEFLSSCKLKRPIGSRVEYSNLGMGLLGHILGLVTGKGYEELVSERILHPLEMHDTSIALSPGQKDRLAPGHTLFGKATANWDIPTLAGAGALRSTVRDMLRFMAANMGCAGSKDRANGSLAEAIELCQREYPKPRKALPSWTDYAQALFLSGLGLFAQWQFRLGPHDPSWRGPAFLVAMTAPMIFATNWWGLAPGLLAVATTVAGTHFLQHGHNFRLWIGIAMGLIALSGGFALRRPGLRNQSPMLGWQHQRLYQFPFPRGRRFLWHNGGTGGYRSFVGFIRESEVAVVVLANSAKSVDAVGVQILRLLDRETSASGSR